MKKIILALLILGGCTADQCVKVQAVYNSANNSVIAANNVIAAQQAVLNTIPPTDPLRVMMTNALLRAQAIAQEAQVAAILAKAGVETLCPHIATTQPSK